MFFESFLLNLAVMVILILALIFDYVTKFFSYWYIRHIPYKYPIPFFGSDYHRVMGLRNNTDEVNTLYRQYENKSLIGCIRSRIPDLIVKDPKIAKLMLSKESENFNSRGLCLDRSEDICLRNNPFYAEGEKWSLLRDNFDSILKSQTQKFEQISWSADKYLHEVSGEINVQIFLGNIMNGVFRDLLFKEDLSVNEETVLNKLCSKLRTATLLDSIKTYLKQVFPSVYSLLGLSTIDPEKELLNMIRKTNLIHENMKFDVEGKSKKSSIKPYDIGFSIFSVFVTEGYIPCLNIMTCLLYELSKHPELQSQIRKANKTNSEDNLKNVIKETMRLYPQYSVITRKCVRAFKFPDSDLLIDKGVTVNVPVESIHRDEKYFEDSNVFNPKRFSKESGKTTEEAFIPYGIGPRKCIGEELSQRIIYKITEEILQNYKIETSAKTPQSLVLVDNSFSRVLKTEVWLKFSHL